MAVIKAVNSKASIGKAIDYVTKEEKTDERLISGKDCTPQTAIDEMKATKEQWNKTQGRQYKHYIQSFDPEDRISPDKAHKIGHEWAEKNFKGHEVLIATHVDKGHIHNHFIVNSVNFENGMKLQQSKKDLVNLKDHSDRICEREGLKVIKKPSAQIRYTSAEQGLVQKGKQSWKDEIRKAVDIAKEKATSYKEFKSIMTNDFGFKLREGKYLTYTHPDNSKWRARGYRLGLDYERGTIENGFSRQIESSKHREAAELPSSDRTEHEGARESFEGNKRTQPVNEGLYQGSSGRGYSEKGNAGRTVGETDKHKQRDTGEDGFDIERVRKHASELRQEIRESYGQWKDRNEGEQPKGINQDGSDREITQDKHERDGKDNAKGLEPIRAKDIELIR